MHFLLIPVLLLGFTASLLAADDLPVIPVAEDALRQWDRWHVQQIGSRTYMRSTYDRQGLNHRADASHFLYQLADDKNVTLDVEGAGVLYFIRYNHWHGSPWNYVVDGRSNIIRETSTADPDNPAENSIFLPEGLFVEPLAWTWSTTKGADLIWVPIPFEESFRMEYGRTKYGTGYYIYKHYIPGAELSQPIRSWDGKSPPSEDVLELVGRAGTDIAPPAGTEGVQEKSGTVTVAEEPVTLLKLEETGLVRAIKFSIPRSQALDAKDISLRITWDDRGAASVDAPLPLFFGTGTFYNHDQREHLVKAFPVNVRDANDRIEMACYFPMPFFKSASFELVPHRETSLSDVKWSIRWQPVEEKPQYVGYFHATYRDHPEPELGREIELLDTREIEGGGDWSGHFIGTSFIFSHDAVLNTLEGDPRFYFDDSQSPQAQGTGTEEWGGGGDYWGGRTMTLPFAGHPVGGPNRNPRSEEDKIESAYRFLLSDLMPFGKNARIHLEHGGENQSEQHYETIAYWYGIPAPSLIRTDELDIGNEASEDAHNYSSPDASDPYRLLSRYEWGPDHTFYGMVFPPHWETVRTTTGTSEFTLQVDPDNIGVMLRRTLDYLYPNQRAEVFVADASDGQSQFANDDFEPAGVWYLAGSNTAVFSNPSSETGASEPRPWESNRRFRDDEFLLPRDLTKGRSAIRVRVKFTPVERPLIPGLPIPELAWSEIRYQAYSYVVPDFDPLRE